MLLLNGFLDPLPQQRRGLALGLLDMCTSGVGIVAPLGAGAALNHLDPAGYMLLIAVLYAAVYATVAAQQGKQEPVPVLRQEVL